MYFDLLEQFYRDGCSRPVEEMAKAEGRYRDMTFYHGTPTLKNACEIVQHGIVPDKHEGKYIQGSMAVPYSGRVYVTAELRYAVIYALGGVVMGHDVPASDIKKYGRYGFVFEVSGDQFGDVQPDEDSVGEMAVKAIRGDNDLTWLSRLTEDLVERGDIPQDIMDEALDEEYEAWIIIGKILLDALSDEQKLELIDEGAHVSHEGTLIPEKIWAIDRYDLSKLNDDVSNFSDVAIQVSKQDIMKLDESLDEATPTDIKRKQKSINKLFPQFPERVKAVQDKGGLRLKKVDQETWHWKIHSGTKKDVWYDAVVHFKGVEPLLRKLVADRRLWNRDRTKVDLNKLSREFMKRADIQLGCSCAAQKYWGGDYILSKPKYDAKYGDKEDRAPNIRNPKQYGAHCFDERAMVLMGDGTYKSIRDVQVGDMVVTHTGKVVPVIETMWSWSDDLYEMKVEGFGGQFSVTGNHEFYVRDRNRQCLCGCGGELDLNSVYYQRGRQAIFDRKHVSGHCKRVSQLDDVSDQMQWLPVEDLDVSTLFYCPVPVFGEEIFVDPGLARLLGYYLAEGCVRYHYCEGCSDIHFVNGAGKSVKASGVNFALNVNERDTLGSDIERLCELCFSKPVTMKVKNIRENDSYLSVDVHGLDVVIPFLEWIGVRNKEKVLSSHIMNMNRDAKVQFVLGACLGDGHVDRGRMIYVTANERIAQQMHSMVTSLGIRASLNQYKSSCQNGFEGVRYFVGFMLYDAPEEMIKVLMDFGKCDMYPIRSENRSRDYLYGHGGMFRVVRELRPLNRRCAVYNLEVGDEDHSYIVNGIAVHNCKHLQNLFKALPFYADTMAKWLNDFYPQLIGEVEKEAGEEADKFKRAGEELRKRKVTKEKPVRKPVRPAKAKEEPRVVEPRKEPEKEPEREEEPQKEEPERKVEPEKEEPEREEEPQKEEERPVKAQGPEEGDIPDQMEEPEEDESEEDEDKEDRRLWTV